MSYLSWRRCQTDYAPLPLTPRSWWATMSDLCYYASGVIATVLVVWALAILLMVL